MLHLFLKAKLCYWNLLESGEQFGLSPSRFSSIILNGESIRPLLFIDLNLSREMVGVNMRHSPVVNLCVVVPPPVPAVMLCTVYPHWVNHCWRTEVRVHKPTQPAGRNHLRSVLNTNHLTWEIGCPPVRELTSSSQKVDTAHLFSLFFSLSLSFSNEGSLQHTAKVHISAVWGNHFLFQWQSQLDKEVGFLF